METNPVYPPPPDAPAVPVEVRNLTFASPAACEEFMGGVDIFSGLYFAEVLRLLEMTGAKTLADLKTFVKFWVAIMSPGAKERFAEPDISRPALDHAVRLVNAFNNDRTFTLKYAKKMHAEYAAKKAAANSATPPEAA